MVGPVRKEKARTAKVYERKVRFKDDDDVLYSSTPVKLATPSLIPGAEAHRFRKRKSVDEWRRRTGMASPPFFGEEVELLFDTSKPYPKTPIKKPRKTKRRSLPTDMKFGLSSGGGMSPSPTGKVIGMPDITDFSETPEILCKNGGSLFPCVGQNTSPAFNAFGLPTIPENVCSCENLFKENIEWRSKYDSLKREYQKLKRFMRDFRGQLEAQGVRIDDELMFDADDENENENVPDPDMAIVSFFTGPSTPDLSMSSYSSPSTSCLLSPAIAEPGTPAAPPTLPVRRIDEDYDEGCDARSVRIGQAPLEDTSMDDEVSRLVDDTSTKLRIVEDKDDFGFLFPDFSQPLTQMPQLEDEDFFA